MARLDFQIAKVAHNRNISELDEGWSTVTFAQEKLLTGVTPSLEIGRIGAVLYEADDVILYLQEMRAHYGRWPVAMLAKYCKGTFGIRGHVGMQ
jgi:hypothetical protein